MSETPKKFIFTGGGSGGHVSPALAVATALKKKIPDAQILYVGIRNKAEGKMVPKAGFPLKFVNSAPFPGKSPFKLLKFFLTLTLGMIKAKMILLRFRPDVVFATGGYVSAPIVFMASILRKLTLGLFNTKILIHESNVHPGKMNKWAAQAADAVGVSFSETIKMLPKGKGFFCGYPVRSSVSSVDRTTARKVLGIPKDDFVVFAFGGSQGSRTINRALADAATQLLKNPSIHIMHGTGKPFGENSNYNGITDVEERLKKTDPSTLENNRYRRMGFIDNMGLYYGASDLVIIRAGAGSIMEVCGKGLPSIIIPISGIYSDHQTGNARFIERAGAAEVLYEDVDPVRNITIPFVKGTELAETIFRLKNSPEKLEKMGQIAQKLFPNNADEIAADYLTYLYSGRNCPQKPDTVKFESDRILGLTTTQLENFLKRIAASAETPLNDDEKRLLKNKINGLIATGDVICRARGFRIAGLAQYREIIPVMISSGIDNNEKPFAKRDAFIGLCKLMPIEDIHKNKLVEMILSGLSDSYYEVRSEAAKCTAIFAQNIELTDSERENILEKLYTNLHDRSFEVSRDAIIAIGIMAIDGNKAVENMSYCYFDKVWKTREAIFAALEKLVERDIIEPEKALEEMDKILITSNGYLTRYELKEQFNKSRQNIEKRR